MATTGDSGPAVRRFGAPAEALAGTTSARGAGAPAPQASSAKEAERPRALNAPIPLAGKGRFPESIRKGAAAVPQPGEPRGDTDTGDPPASGGKSKLTEKPLRPNGDTKPVGPASSVGEGNCQAEKPAPEGVRDEPWLAPAGDGSSNGCTEKPSTPGPGKGSPAGGDRQKLPAPAPAVPRPMSPACTTVPPLPACSFAAAEAPQGAGIVEAKDFWSAAATSSESKEEQLATLPSRS